MSPPTGPGSPGTVLITGAASGIGRAAAVLFAQRGWRCVLVDHDAERLQLLQRELETRHPRQHLGISIDLTQAPAIPAMANDLPELDALINNAGMSNPGLNALATLESDPAASLVALNLLAPARVVQACAHRLKAAARIVNVTSGAALRAIPARGLYSPSKAGLLEQTRALAHARPRWTVTSLSPGFVKTELVQQLMETGKLQVEQALAKIPLGRLAEPWEMAQALFFLAAQSPRLLSGQTLVVCGGSSVYGGSQPLAAADYDRVPPETTACLEVASALPGPWRDIEHELNCAVQDNTASIYRGVIEGASLLASAGQVLLAVQQAAERFFNHQRGPASLTLLLPARTVDWEHAGDLAAARMLISTLAVEWGSRGLRINALEVTDAVPPDQCLSLIRYIAGPSAQYLTGQTLRLGHNIEKATP